VSCYCKFSFSSPSDVSKGYEEQAVGRIQLFISKILLNIQNILVIHPQVLIIINILTKDKTVNQQFYIIYRNMWAQMAQCRLVVYHDSACAQAALHCDFWPQITHLLLYDLKLSQRQDSIKSSRVINHIR
jgi:hypothetical protein